MLVRRVVYSWLLPAALALPAWLVLGWLIFSREPWSLLPILLIFVPAVFVGQLVMALLVRSRPGVRDQRAVSWYDVGAFGAWHVLTFLVGFYTAPLFSVALPLAIIVGLGTLALVIWELWTDGRRSVSSFGDVRARMSSPSRGTSPTIVMRESTADEPTTERPDRAYGFGERPGSV